MNMMLNPGATGSRRTSVTVVTKSGVTVTGASRGMDNFSVRLVEIDDLVRDVGLAPDLETHVLLFVEEVRVGRVLALAVSQPPGPTVGTELSEMAEQVVSQDRIADNADRANFGQFRRHRKSPQRPVQRRGSFT